MKTGDEDSSAHEIVIVRRGHGDDDHGHHGGAWKIAYADFMTAMMAFFLVMWLINSSDEKTLTQVAAYFNPLKLTDKNPMPKGVHEMSDPDSGEKPKTEEHKEKPKKKPKSKPGSPSEDAKGEKEESKHKSEQDNSGSTEETLFSDPYGVLAKLASEVDISKKSTGDTRQGSGDAFRDPFDPAYQRQPTPDATPSDQKEAARGPETPDTEAGKTGGKTAGDAKEESKDDGKDAAAKKNGAQPPSDAAADAGKPLPPNATPIERERFKVDGEIVQALKAAGIGALPRIEVTVTGDGLLVSLTDDLNFSMFDSASARPRPELVIAMEKIGKVLAGHDGKLIVRGHTDSRPFKDAKYDNWRLSTSRAHMAYYMLVRGGLPETRFERVEGYADRSPKLPKTPEAAQNRRIEILMREQKR
jgi:chemotaxis protein MotB